MNADRYEENHHMVQAIDLNNVHRREIDAAQYIDNHLTKLVGPAYVAFLHFYFEDNANAQFHVADTRYSPITFRLAEALEGLVNDPGMIEEVLSHRGQYEEDPGR